MLFQSTFLDINYPRCNKKQRLSEGIKLNRMNCYVNFDEL